MFRWVWRILREEGALAIADQSEVPTGSSLLGCDCQDGSQLWRSIQTLKHEIRKGARFSIGKGEGTLFWLDTWLGESSFQQRFPSLFAICSDPMLLLASAVHTGVWNISFWRTFGLAEATAWTELRGSLPEAMPGGQDLVSWHMEPSGIFSVKTAHRSLFSGHVRAWVSPLWKAP